MQPGMVAETVAENRATALQEKESLSLTAVTLGSATMFVTPNFHVSGRKISSQTQWVIHSFHFHSFYLLL